MPSSGPTLSLGQGSETKGLGRPGIIPRVEWESLKYFVDDRSVAGVPFLLSLFAPVTHKLLDRTLYVIHVELSGRRRVAILHKDTTFATTYQVRTGYQ